MWREVETHAKGRCLVAARPIKPEAEILRCPADAHAISPPERTTRCAHCLKAPGPEEKPPARCAGCQWQHYCSRRCQQGDWPRHKEECKSLRRLASKSPGPTLLMAARLIRAVVREARQGKGSSSLVVALERLVHHEEALPPARRELMRQMAALVLDLCCTGGADPAYDGEVQAAVGARGGVPFVARLLMRIGCNSFTITDDEGKDIGIGLFLGAVAANHSCDPNAHAVFEGPTLRLRALRPIEPGEEICIGYVDVARPRWARQEDLRKGYGFACSCRRCQSVEEDVREVRSMAWLCPREGCGGSCVDDGRETALFRAWRGSKDGSDLDKVEHEPRPRRCLGCGHRLSSAEVTERMGDLALAEGFFERGRAKLGKYGDPRGAMELLEQARAAYARVLPDEGGAAFHLQEVESLLAQAAVGAQDWERARRYLAKIVADGFPLAPPQVPGPAYEILLLGKLEFHLGRLPEAIMHLTAALRRLETSHGADSPTVQQLRMLLREAEYMQAQG